MASPRLVDAGYISQPLRFSGTTLIRASFDGEIDGSGSHAAHVSLHGKQLAMTLPPGVYTNSRVFQAILPDLGEDSSQSLIFGLGGWAIGSGHLRLTKLEVFGFKISSAEGTTNNYLNRK